MDQYSCPRVLTSLDQMLFLSKIFFSFFYKTSKLIDEVNCTEPSAFVSVPCAQCCNVSNLRIFVISENVCLMFVSKAGVKHLSGAPLLGWALFVDIVS
jgi:hypothetical protein